jgi:hypothetical protein
VPEITMEVRLSAGDIARVSAYLIAGFLAAHVLVQSARFVSGNDSLFGLVTMFSLGSDRNFPTFYSALAIFLCAVLLAVAGHASRQRYTWHWYGLALVFLFLASDEILEIHERTIEPMRGLINATGLLYYAWVVPYGLAALLLAIIYLRFLLHLPARTRSLFISAGLLFVAGALGFEMLGGWYSELHGNRNVVYVLYQTVEELLEMTGIAVFLYALADYLQDLGERGWVLRLER